MECIYLYKRCIFPSQIGENRIYWHNVAGTSSSGITCITRILTIWMASAFCRGYDYLVSGCLEGATAINNPLTYADLDYALVQLGFEKRIWREEHFVYCHRETE